MLPNGDVVIREVRPDDADALVSFYAQLDTETSFMLYEPGERQTTPEKQRQRLEQLAASEEDVMFTAELDGNIVGFAAGMGGGFKRNRHSLYLVIGLLQAHAGKGIGHRLMQALEDWARASGFHRLELTVMTHNRRAIALYRRCGFEEEGVKRHSLLVDGHYVDELYMAKLL